MNQLDYLVRDYALNKGTRFPTRNEAESFVVEVLTERYQATEGSVEHNEDKSLYWHTASADHIERHWAEFRIYEPEINHEPH